jgi:hypothetical protein
MLNLRAICGNVCGAASSFIDLGPDFAAAASKVDQTVSAPGVAPAPSHGPKP